MPDVVFMALRKDMVVWIGVCFRLKMIVAHFFCYNNEQKSYSLPWNNKHKYNQRQLTVAALRRAMLLPLIWRPNAEGNNGWALSIASKCIALQCQWIPIDFIQFIEVCLCIVSGVVRDLFCHVAFYGWCWLRSAVINCCLSCLLFASKKV